MESIYSELALSGSKNLCARTNTVFFPISEVSDGTVSLIESALLKPETLQWRERGKYKVNRDNNIKCTIVFAMILKVS